MASDKNRFDRTGPLHLTYVDWDNAHHRRSVAASLVHGVYILEEDRQERREGPNALAVPWWTFFHFQLLRRLDDVDSSIFGAIYEFKPSTSMCNETLLCRSPRYVIAFRGTMAKAHSVSRDIELDIHVLRNSLHQTSRSEIAIQAVRNMVATVGASNIWLTGHSLGSAMAMLIGKTMAKTGVFIQSFLFNPPYVSGQTERIKDVKLKHRVRFAGSIVTAGLAIVFKAKQKKSLSFDSFAALSAWVPCLFVNPSDYICSEYIGYFEHRRKMGDIGAGSIEKLATQTSLGCLVMEKLIGFTNGGNPTYSWNPSSTNTKNSGSCCNILLGGSVLSHAISGFLCEVDVLNYVISGFGVMASEREYFDRSGPLHLTYVDWNNAYHRKSVAASLVQGVYVLEKDRQQRREGPNALALPWWTFFHFQLLHTLVDDVDSSIFGAIYAFKPPTSMCTLRRSTCYVIAFRGTITKADSVYRDIELDMHFVRNGLHQTSRSEIAIQAVRNIVATVGASNIWLAGHSLGSAMAMLAGKTMAKTGIFIESFLFNPPYLSAPIERIKDKKLKHGLRFAGSVVTAGLAIAMKAKQKKSLSFDPFAALSAWIPCLFVNPSDHICSEYIGYFEHRKKMEEIGAGSIEKLATQTSLGCLVMGALGKESDEPLHLIPSASLTVNHTPSRDFIESHGIHQWWKPDLRLESKLYQY
ncbi:unnamed protein product [Sphenostylis stenocarpa]|uniref:Fungal lipase-type domain-containing protein n=1 Tax=Sphenostylis stenocarpa TaxID=92480 RepID=A0AA86VCE9_9FABA|nr:unnamed protein product [Sphenostylis stenocarpa]